MSSPPETDKPARAPGPRAAPCPICGQPARPAHRPFCTPGCRDRDLLAWLDGRYAIPAAPDHSALDNGDEDG